MSQQNVEVIGETFRPTTEATTAGVGLLAPDASGKSVRSCLGDGPAAVRRMSERWDRDGEEFQSVPEEFIHTGEHLIVAVRYRAAEGQWVEVDDRLFDATRSGMASVSGTRVSRPIPGPRSRRVERLAATSLGLKLLEKAHFLPAGFARRSRGGVTARCWSSVHESDRLASYVPAVLRLARREPSAVLLAAQLAGGPAVSVHGGQRRRPRAVQRLRHRGARAGAARGAQHARADLVRSPARPSRRPCCC